MRFKSSILRLFVLITAIITLLVTKPILAQQNMQVAQTDYRQFIFSLPFYAGAAAFEREGVNVGAGAMEYNLQMMATLGLEGIYVPSEERLSDKEVLETKNSMGYNTHQYRVMLSRYTDPAKMAGLYWSLGAGYRQSKIDWVEDYKSDSDVDLSLVDENNKVRRDILLKGVTGHFRVGFRYVGDEYPIVVGASVGVNHFQSGIAKSEDLEKQALDERRPLTKSEETRLKSLMMTTMEPLVYFGWAL
ncbi:MAG: hypothetical protein KBD78_10645 [Oligoflexales bacterium]|nr:hypothetical protein [Oligoflexales bacterium]